ncbi:diacylglycerol kinase [Weissella sagaensis]|jgi:diacylglycerol kinase (ATP)|uniref:diacylglycerol kinase n=1 Tax=Weissella sagaensis TaxID=2559928 RepID=UPI0005A81FDF|nr:diacylglycerol kinase [Weissella sagaensis]KAA8432370.1 diacylglycerol kinase [Weissella paramesenteroides]MBU7567707.1 diacylglycerol kinase [Weissella hellenica]KAA8439363.1 diacylglycerol kinase [Weissella paramesenteroides]QEA57536.1 diacylglycerol kinase [Weissella hellenica]UEG66697.1 diacylglycerol kinase [Weissella hellenica]
MKRARIIYNPTSGREAIRRDLVDILDVYEQAGYETSAFATTPEENSAMNEATRAAKAGFDLIIAAGGDGTINEVVNGIAPLEHRPMMAIIPAGTTNDYARALRIPREDPLAAARVILKGRAAKMDIGQSNDSYFINIAAGGSLSELTYSVPSKLKSMYGYLAYVVKGAEMLTSIKPMDLHIKYDDGEFKGKSAMFFLALTNSVGGFEQIVPDAKLDDGKFTLLIVKTTKFAEILNLITEVLKGKHINNPNLIYAKSERVEVSSLKNDKIMINLDGEYGGDAPVTFINHKQHIKIVANIDDAASDMLIDAPVELND